MPNNPADILAMMRDLESDRVERKESLKGDAATKLREAVCAFANDLPGHRAPGMAFVGVRDDGTPSGLAVTDELLRALADIRSDGNIVPPPSLRVEKQTVDGHDIAVVTVQPSDSPPVRYRGRIWVRVGPTRAIATAQDERILNERRRHRTLPFDVHPIPLAALDDLAMDVFSTIYLPSAYAPDVIHANSRTMEQQLAATKMVANADDPVPTNLGMLVLGKHTRDYIPGAYVQFLRIQGRSLGDAIIDQATIDGHLADLLRHLDDKLEAHTRTAVDISSSSRELRFADYPRGALQQLARNAVMHRTYEGTNSPVRITWYDDRIEIISPGGPYGVVGVDNFGRPGVTDYRNPNLAEAMKVLGFVQRFGVGIATARSLLIENGNPPLEFQVDPAFVCATVRPRL